MPMTDWDSISSGFVGTRRDWYCWGVHAKVLCDSTDGQRERAPAYTVKRRPS